MESLTALKTAHVLAIVLLLGSALGLALWTWRARRAGDAAAVSYTHLTLPTILLV